MTSQKNDCLARFLILLAQIRRRGARGGAIGQWIGGFYSLFPNFGFRDCGFIHFYGLRILKEFACYKARTLNPNDRQKCFVLCVPMRVFVPCFFTALFTPANSKVQKPPFSLPSIIITVTSSEP